MDISQTNTATAATAGPAGATDNTTGGGGAINSDFETFLRMLTAQIENQDPLNPIESSDFAVQLATFSGVEQQVRTNELLEGLAGSLGGSAMAQYADWVGREVRAAAPAYFDGAPVEVSVDPAANADTAELVVRDESGRIVDRREIAPAAEEVTWDGLSVTGQSFLTGLYSFSVESRSGDDVIADTPAQITTRVTEVRVDETGAVRLVFEGGGTTAPDAVTALRAT